MTPLHLDDEALSAAVDGEATADEQDHLEGCPLCRERAAGLRAVALAVGTPVSPRPAGEIDAAIRAAVDAVEGVSAAGAGAAGAVGAVGAAAARAAKPATVRAPVGWHQPASRRARGVLALAAVAVLVLGAGLVVALTGRGPSSGRNASVAARSVQGTAFGPQPDAAAPSGPSTTIGLNPAAGQASSGASSAKGLPVQGSDLGNQSNSTELAHVVDRQLAAAAARPSVTAEPGTLATVPPCLDQGAAALGLAGQHPTLAYMATVRWLGQDSEVLVYDPGAGRAGVVMGRQDCKLLTTLPL